MKLLFPLYPRFTALDVVGPYEMLARVPGCSVELVAEHAGPVANDLGTLILTATTPWNQHQAADIIVVPGGPGTSEALSSTLPQWLAAMRPRTTWMASVCSGSLILGAAGLLTGQRATSHYRVRQALERFGARPVDERVVTNDDTRTITAAGVSAGLDLGLQLAARLSDNDTAQAIQLWTEYDPEPPFHSGSPTQATPEVRRLAADMERSAR